MTESVQVGALVLQGALVVTVLEGIRRRNISVIVNALVALAAAVLPAIVAFVLEFAFEQSVSFGPELPLWIAAAGLLHSLGMLGLYESTWWWDHLAHAVSAALVTALIYAGIIVVARHSTRIGALPGGIVGTTLLFIVAIGVFWELIELVARYVGELYDIEPVLVHYGWRDTTLDLVFNLVGALSVIVLDLRLFVPIAEQYPHVTEIVVLGVGAAIVIGSGLMALGLGLGGKISQT